MISGTDTPTDQARKSQISSPISLTLHVSTSVALEPEVTNHTPVLQNFQNQVKGSDHLNMSSK